MKLEAEARLRIHIDFWRALFPGETPPFAVPEPTATAGHPAVGVQTNAEHIPKDSKQAPKPNPWHIAPETVRAHGELAIVMEVAKTMFPGAAKITPFPVRDGWLVHDRENKELGFLGREQVLNRLNRG